LNFVLMIFFEQTHIESKHMTHIQREQYSLVD